MPAPQPSPDDIEEKRQPKRKPLPDHLPRNVTVLEAGDACASCGGKLKRLGEDVTEELEYVPGRFVVNRIVRPRMACSCCERITQAALPSRPIERGRPGSGLLAHVLVNKYTDHLPLYGNHRYSNARGSILSVQPLRTGWANQRRCWSRWPTQVAAMFCAGRRSSPTTRQSKCRLRGQAGQKPRGSGHTREMTAHGLEMHPRPRGISSASTARAYVQSATSRTIPAGCTPMVMPGSRSFIAQAVSTRLPAWRISGASSLMCNNPKAPPSPKRRSGASLSFTRSRKRRVDRLRMNGCD